MMRGAREQVDALIEYLITQLLTALQSPFDDWLRHSIGERMTQQLEQLCTPMYMQDSIAQSSRLARCFNVSS